MAVIKGKWRVKQGAKRTQLVKGKSRESVSEHIRKGKSKRVKVVRRGTT